MRRIRFATRPPIWGVELGGSGEVPCQSRNIIHKLFAQTDTPSLSVYEPIAIYVLSGGRHPFGEGAELGDRMLYPLKVIHSMHNLFAGIDTLSLSVYEPIAMRFVGDRPPFGRGVGLGSGRCGTP